MYVRHCNKVETVAFRIFSVYMYTANETEQKAKSKGQKPKWKDGQWKKKQYCIKYYHIVINIKCT